MRDPLRLTSQECNLGKVSYYYKNQKKEPKGKTSKTWAKLTGIARETKEFYGEIGMMENKSGEVVVTISGEEKLLKYATPGTLRDAKPRGVPESAKMIIKTEMDAYFKK
ncbi:hypothetical protein L2E82_39566 [Cichorium intybus]|uniref:Uncharacterized protein n=1 Tax=Cichorium intybus TaxID=13427 RepID=A0ACB9AJJ6_CICIN|nr:hypothetical protein L2E82_39566 [Cichorium intybus]